MPLPPLPNPKSRRERIRGLSRGVPATVFLGSTLMGMNALQTASLAIRPLSRSRFRKVNRWAADTWWGLCVTLGERLHDVNLELTGDDVPMRENAIVVVNHQDMADITFLMAFARSKDRLGDLKWFVKKPIKYVPGIGWGMVFLDCLFVERNWSADRASIEATFQRILDDRIPIWLISFVEGTRTTPDKVARSQEYARKQGLAPLEHVLIPRTKGFVASMQGLRNYIDAVYDLTIGYERGVPNLWQYIKGFAPRAHLHVRRYPVSSLPESEEEMGAWLHERFREKDQLLARFYERGAFAAGEDPRERDERD
ncbi:MAG: lysophospholipid acyltransferase family protein [Myxococcota bacterium]